MNIWHVRLHTINPVEGFPCISGIGHETWISKSYGNWGRNRRPPAYGIFQYTLEGAGIFEDATGVHRLGRGKGFICESCDVETAYYYPQDSDAPWRFIYCSFMGKANLELVRSLIRKHGGVYSLAPDSGIIREFMELPKYKEGHQHLEVTPSENAMLAMKLISSLAASKEENIDRSPGNLLVRKSRKILAEYSDKAISVSELADMLDVSREHLSRVFSEQTGYTPHEYIMRQRMYIACQMLHETNLSIKEIAYKLGYERPVNFTRAFTRFVGTTPKEFRKGGELPELYRG
jgi:AraC-like DNA-binding protein